ASDYLHVVLAESIEPERFGGRKHFSIGANFLVAVLRRPLGDVTVKTFAVADHRRKQQQIAALLQFTLQPSADFITSLPFGRHLAVGTELRPEPREKQAEEVVNLGDGRHGALAAAAGVALLDAHRGRDAGDEVRVRPRKLLDELPRVNVHRIEKASLAFGE